MSKTTREPKTKQISAKISLLALRILESERKTTGESQGRYIERLVFEDPKLSEDSVKIIAEDSLKDPKFMVRYNAVAASGARKERAERDNNTGP
jgi:hypothetical protein